MNLLYTLFFCLLEVINLLSVVLDKKERSGIGPDQKCIQDE
jgi:hypothetical protein